MTLERRRTVGEPLSPCRAKVREPCRTAPAQRTEPSGWMGRRYRPAARRCRREEELPRSRRRRGAKDGEGGNLSQATGQNRPAPEPTATQRSAAGARAPRNFRYPECRGAPPAWSTRRQGGPSARGGTLSPPACGAGRHAQRRFTANTVSHHCRYRGAADVWSAGPSRVL